MPVKCVLKQVIKYILHTALHSVYAILPRYYGGKARVSYKVQKINKLSVFNVLLCPTA